MEYNARLADSQPFSVQRFSLNVSERRLVLGVVDILLLNIALFIAPVIRGGPQFGVSIGSLWSLALSSIWLSCAATLQLYNLPLASDIQRSLGRTAVAALLTCLTYMSLSFVTPAFSELQRDIILFPILLFVSTIVWRAIYATKIPGVSHRAVLVGMRRSGEQLARVAQESREHNATNQHFGYQFVGYLSEEAASSDGITGLPHLGTLQDLRTVSRNARPQELIICDELANTLVYPKLAPNQLRRRQDDLISSHLFDILLECRELGIAITTASAVYEQHLKRVPLEEVSWSLTVALPLHQTPTYRLYLLARRIVDMIVGLAGCLLIGLLIPFLWLANRILSPGPIFYSQDRVGEGGRIFKVWKFRSMAVDAEKFVGAVWASENDLRITKVGNLLRKTRLDEIPQFWNILQGDMSLIGPRPERPQFVNHLVDDLPVYRARHAIKPGLTGWAQVQYRYGASVEDTLIKLQYDLYYIKYIGPIMDLQIVLQTIPVMLGFKGR